MRAGLIILLAASWVVAPVGRAAASGYCVDARVGLPDARLDWSFCDPGPTPCVGATVYSSIGEALEAQAVAGGGPILCVGTPDIHEEAVEVFNTDGRHGNNVSLLFATNQSPNYCPEEGSPGFSIEGDALLFDPVGLYVQQLHLDPTACGHPTGSFFDGQGVGLGLDDSRVLGGSGTLIAVGSISGLEVSSISRSRLEGITGPLLAGTTTVLITDTEIAGNVSTSAPLLDLPAGLDHEIHASALFGNTVSGGHPLIQLGGDLALDRSVVAANVVLDAAPLLGVDLSDVGAAGQVVISRSVFSRNRLLSSGTVDAPQVWPRPTVLPDADNVCLPWGSDQLDYLGRAGLSITDPVLSDAALFDVDGGVGTSTGIVAVYKTFVIDNEWDSGGAVLRTSGELPDLQLLLVHDTLTNHSGLLVDGGGTGPGAALGSARNLLLGSPVVTLGAGFDAADVTMDQVESGNQAWVNAFATLAGVHGPVLPAPPWASLFAPLSDLTDHLGRAILLCPNLYSDTSGLGPGGGTAPCALDLASSYVPDVDEAIALAVPWPWRDTVLPGLAAGDLQNTPGATGWTCDGQLPPAYDQLDFGFGPSGDADSYSTLVDCDNASGGTVPELPPDDGYNSADCDHIEGDCYLCPDEFGDDDDDSSGPADDDDTTPADDDDCAQPDDDDSGSQDDDASDDDDDSAGGRSDTFAEGCDAEGCGYSWHMSGLLVLLPLMARRRTSLDRPTRRSTR